MRELLDLMYDFPAVFDQMEYDYRLVNEKRASEKMPWKRADETVPQARDRLRAERERAKAELAAKLKEG